MSQVFSIGRLILFFISSIGYWEFFRKKGKISVYFLPGFTVAFQISVLFLSGLLNCLKQVSILLFIIGLALAVYFLVREKKALPKKYLNEGFVFLFCGVCVCMIALRGRLFSHFDNFTHWAVVVKTMLSTNRFPNFQDAISFQAYPLGSSVYIYYFAKVISHSEWIQMLAQSYMMLCFILPIFKNGKKYRILNFVILAVFTNFIFCYNNRITELLVDTLLPLAGMAAVFFVFSECIKKDEDGEKVSFLYAIPFLCTVIQIKNSGILFAVLACIVVITAVLRYKMDWKSGVAACVVPFLSLFLWQRHCAYVFSYALNTRHAMSISYFTNTFSNKTTEGISDLAQSIGVAVFQEKDLYIIIAFLLAVTAITAVFLRHEYRKMIEVWAVCVSLYLVYLLGMFFMYLFSMPGTGITSFTVIGAASLAAFERYMSTIYISLYYIIMWYFLSALSRIEIKIKRLAAAFTAVLMLVVSWRFHNDAFDTIFSPFRTESERTWYSRRVWYENVAKQYGIQPQKSFFICIPFDDGGFAANMCFYMFSATGVSPNVISEDSQLEDATRFDYVILYDSENEIIQKWVSENYPEQAGQDVIFIT